MKRFPWHFTAKYEWGKERYIDKCTRKERMGIMWLKAGIWIVRGIRRGLKEEGAPYVWGTRMLSTDY
jgi:hypothetical protein